MRTRTLARTSPSTRILQVATVALGAWAGSTGSVRADVVENGASGFVVETIPGQLWTITAPNGTILEYTSFDLAMAQQAMFMHGAGERVLNRISGAMTTIDGMILAPNGGIVYLVNPAGIAFTQNAVIDVGGLYAAAGNVADDAMWQAGMDDFVLAGAVTVANGAQIRTAPDGTNLVAGPLHLLGTRVENHGLLESGGGYISMVAGNTINLQEMGGRLIVTVDGQQLNGVDGPVMTATGGNLMGIPAVRNTGTVRSHGGDIVFGAGDLASLALLNDGTVDAGAGRVEFVAADGAVVNSATGVVSGSELTMHGGEVGVAGTLTATGDVRLASADIVGTVGATVTGDRVTLDGKEVFVDGTINASDTVLRATDSMLITTGSVINTHNLTITADADMDGAGSAIISTDLTITGDAVLSGADIYYRTGSLTSGGSQIYHGLVTFGQDTTLTGSFLVFNGNLDAKAINPGFDGLPDITLNGNVVFESTVGGLGTTQDKFLRSLTVNGDTIMNFGLGIGAVRTILGQTYNGSVLLGADTILVSQQMLGSPEGFGDIVFNGTVDGPHGLLVVTGGETRFMGTVGGTAPLVALLTDAQGTVVLGADVFAGGVSFQDLARLDTDVTVQGTTFTEMWAVDGAGHDLTVASPNSSFFGDIANVATLSTDAAGTTTISNASIVATNVDFGDTVEVAGNVALAATDTVRFGQTVDGAANLTVAGGRQVRFGGDVGGTTALASLDVEGGRTLNDVNGIVFDGQLVRANGDIRLNAAGRATPTAVASIAGNGSLTIESLNGNVTMGQNEKLTALGDLMLLATAGRVTVGDLNALGSIMVMAPAIDVWARSGGSILNADGTIGQDTLADIIAGNALAFLVTPNVIGAGARPVFATGTGGGISSTLDGFTRSAVPGLTASAFVFGGVVLDLATSSAGNTAEALDGGILEIERDVDREAFAIRVLDQIGLDMRGLTTAEVLSTLDRAALYDDTPSTGLTRDPSLITTTRLRRDSVLRVIDLYTALFLGEDAAPDAQPDPEPIRRALGDAWDDYAQSQGPDPDPSGFRAFLAASEVEAHAAALGYLDDLGSLCRNLSTMGATPREYQVCIDRVLNPLTESPDCIAPEALRSAMMGAGEAG